MIMESSNSTDIFVDEQINSSNNYSNSSADSQSQSKTNVDSVKEILSESDMKAGFTAVLKFWKSLPVNPRKNLMISFNGEFLSTDFVPPTSLHPFSLPQTSQSLLSIALLPPSSTQNVIDSSRPATNYKPTYCYKNNPLDGWNFCIDVNIDPDGPTPQDTSNANQINGQTTVYYQPPNYPVIRNTKALEDYIRSNILPYKTRKYIDFGSVFCVCHAPEDLDRNYIECSYGLTGCFGWIHPECVGLGPLSREEILAMKSVICPPCVAFLKGAGTLHKYTNDTIILLNKITAPFGDCSYRDSVTVVNQFCIEESSVGHKTWGYQPSLSERQLAYEKQQQQRLQQQQLQLQHQQLLRQQQLQKQQLLVRQQQQIQLLKQQQLQKQLLPQQTQQPQVVLPPQLPPQHLLVQPSQLQPQPILQQQQRQLPPPAPLQQLQQPSQSQPSLLRQQQQQLLLKQQQQQQRQLILLKQQQQQQQQQQHLQKVPQQVPQQVLQQQQHSAAVSDEKEYAKVKALQLELDDVLNTNVISEDSIQLLLEHQAKNSKTSVDEHKT